MSSFQSALLDLLNNRFRLSIKRERYKEGDMVRVTVIDDRTNLSRSTLMQEEGIDDGMVDVILTTTERLKSLMAKKTQGEK